jgi:Tat protein translocase TatB subunit
MFGIGIGEIILILVIGTLVVGPERMVAFARDAGRMLAKFRRETDSVSQEFREALELDDIREALTEAQSELQDVARDLKNTQREVAAIAAETEATVADVTADVAGRLPLPGTTPAVARTATSHVSATASATASATGTASTTSRPPQATPAVVAPTFLRDGEMHPVDVRAVAPAEEAAAEAEPEIEAAVMEVGGPEIVLEDHEVEPVVLDEPILVMDREEADEAEKALREVAAAGVAEALEDEESEPVDETLPPEAEVAQALEGGVSMVITEPLLDEEELDENVIQEDTFVAWETGVQVVVEDESPQDAQAADADVDGDMLPNLDVIVAHPQDDTEATALDAAAPPVAAPEVAAEGVEVPEVVGDRDQANVSREEGDSATEDDAVADGDSKG